MATAAKEKQMSGEEQLRGSDVMGHLMDALGEGKDIGHYGRLVFAMVARHFLSEEEVVEWLKKDRDFSEEQARALYLQVQGRDYSPPKREKLLSYQSQQDFPIVPNPDDPDSGNLYRDLKFPEHVYDHISEYYEEKAEGTTES